MGETSATLFAESGFDALDDLFLFFLSIDSAPIDLESFNRAHFFVYLLHSKAESKCVQIDRFVQVLLSHREVLYWVHPANELDEANREKQQENYDDCQCDESATLR